MDFWEFHDLEIKSAPWRIPLSGLFLFYLPFSAAAFACFRFVYFLFFANQKSIKTGWNRWRQLCWNHQWNELKRPKTVLSRHAIKSEVLPYFTLTGSVIKLLPSLFQSLSHFRANLRSTVPTDANCRRASVTFDVSDWNWPISTLDRILHINWWCRSEISMNTVSPWHRNFPT